MEDQEAQPITQRREKEAPRKASVDIIAQIQDMYQKKAKPTEKKQYLNPTKATLFGLDVRFRHIDKRIADEKAARSLSKLRINDRKGERQNRHKIPQDLQSNQGRSTFHKSHKSIHVLNQNSTLPNLNSMSGANLQAPSIMQPQQKPNTAAVGMRRGRSLNRYPPIQEEAKSMNNQSVSALGLVNQQSGGNLLSPPKLNKSGHEELSGVQTRATLNQQSVGAFNKDQPLSTSQTQNEDLDVFSMSNRLSQEFKMQNPKSKTCFDQLLNERSKGNLPRNQSFVKPPIPQKGVDTKLSKEAQEELKQQRRLNKTQIDMDIAKAKNDTKNLEKQIQADRQAKNVDIGHSDIQVIKKATIFDNAEYKNNLRELKMRAREVKKELLEEEERERQMTQKTTTAKVEKQDTSQNQFMQVYDEMVKQNAEKQIQQQQIVVADQTELVDDDSIIDLDNISNTDKEQFKNIGNTTNMFNENAMPPKMSYIFKCNNLSDDFLFGEDIIVPPNEVEKINQKFKKGKKVYQTTSVAQVSEENETTQGDISTSQYTKSHNSQRGVTKSCTVKTYQSQKSFDSLKAQKQKKEEDEKRQKIEEEYQLQFQKVKNDACNFPKPHNYQSKDIYVDIKKLMSKVTVIETLTKDEQMQLKALKNMQIQKLKNKAEQRFDSEKNWSIMINAKDNQMRNDIMRKIYFQQLKRRSLHDIVRTTRKELIAKRKQDEQQIEEEMMQNDQQDTNASVQMMKPLMLSQQLKRSELATSEDREREKERYLRSQNELKHRMVKEYKGDFLKFFNMKITKEGAAMNPSGDSRVLNSNANNKLPKRKMLSNKDSVDTIAGNLQTLIEFSRGQSQKMRHLKKISTNTNKNELMKLNN